MLHHCTLPKGHAAFVKSPRGRALMRPAVRAAASGRAAAEAAPEESQAPLNRRQLLASNLVLVAAAALAPAARAVDADVVAEAVAEAVAEEVVAEAEEVAPAPPGAEVNPLGQGQLKELYDPILAYKFHYPVATTTGRPLGMIVSRTPEKYSSAAPLTADARQRIVGEVFDFRSFVSASMYVGPASGLLKGRAPAEWKPREVALSVLIDKSTARTTAGQRVALNDVTAASRDARADGLPYWVYEHVSQGSPTITQRGRESYRHALAVTSVRPGLDGTPYLYTLNLSCPEELWPELAPLFEASVKSFALVPTTAAYIPPDKDPWLFF